MFNTFLSMFRLISAASTNATVIKNSGGQVYGIQIFNTNASPRFLKLYDSASLPNVGVDGPVKTLLIPGNASGAGAVVGSLQGVGFTSGISFAITANPADTDATAIGASEVVVNIDYR